MNTQSYHHGGSDHTHVSHASHVTASYRGGNGDYIVSSSPAKNPSLRPPQGRSKVLVDWVRVAVLVLPLAL